MYLHPLPCHNTSATTPPQSIFTLYSARNRPTKKTGIHPLSNSPTLSRLQHTCGAATTVQYPQERRTDAPLRGMHTLDTFSMRRSIRRRSPITAPISAISCHILPDHPRFRPVPYPIQEKYARAQTITIVYFMLLFQMHCADTLAATQSEGEYRPFSG